MDRSKADIRAAMRARRRGLSPAERARAAASACARLMAHEAVRSALLRGGGRNALAVYLAAPDEIDLTAAIEALLARGAAVVAPRWNGAAYDLARLRSLGGEDLRRGPKGVREPAEASLVPPRDVAVWLVPGLAFTRAGDRLGYGGGWYDRLLAESGEDAVKIGVSHAFQVVERLPGEPHDIPLDGLLAV